MWQSSVSGSRKMNYTAVSVGYCSCWAGGYVPADVFHIQTCVFNCWQFVCVAVSLKPDNVVSIFITLVIATGRQIKVENRNWIYHFTLNRQSDERGLLQKELNDAKHIIFIHFFQCQCSCASSNCVVIHCVWHY